MYTYSALKEVITVVIIVQDSISTITRKRDEFIQADQLGGSCHHRSKSVHQYNSLRTFVRGAQCTPRCHARDTAD